MNLFTLIKQRLTILEVVSEYATLKKAGLYWKGCCPFHHERTPSFTVSPHKEIFYCFGCHAGGDVISFVAKIEHCSPIDAAKHLADRHNIPLPENISWEKGTDSQEAKNAYYATCALFARWCQEQLKKHQESLEYLTSRGITPQSINDFSVGFCSGSIKSLLTFAQQENMLAQNFIDAHIIFEGRTGLYTPFEDRIIFPITDTIGRTVGFGGRVYKQGDERVKYYNSHDHTFFTKGTILYGLNSAKKDIASQEAAFLVEGYTDLILMHQHGFKSAVATMGTACTAEQLKVLARYAQKLYIMYDADPAGQNAIMRLVELCWQVALDPYVVRLPGGQDPASFLQAGGSLGEKVVEAQDIFTYVLTHQAEDFSHKSLQDRLGVVKKIVTLIHQIPDGLKRSLLLQQAAETFALPREALMSLRHTTPTSHAGGSASSNQERSAGNFQRTTAANAGANQSAARYPASANPLIPSDPEANMPKGLYRGTAGRQSARVDEMQLTGPDSPTNQPPENPYGSITQLEKKIFSAILLSRVILTPQEESLVRLWFNTELRTLRDCVLKHTTSEGIDMRALFEELSEEDKAFVSQCISIQELAPEEEDAAYIRDIMTHFFKKQWKLTVHNVKLGISEAQQEGNPERVKLLLNHLDEVKQKMQGGTI